jgi:hypothetical protein
MALPQKSVSFTPGFSPVPEVAFTRKPFQRFCSAELWKPLKRFLNNISAISTGLKPGVNESALGHQDDDKS